MATGESEGPAMGARSCCSSDKIQINTSDRIIEKKLMAWRILKYHMPSNLYSVCPYSAMIIPMHGYIIPSIPIARCPKDIWDDHGWSLLVRISLIGNLRSSTNLGLLDCLLGLKLNEVLCDPGIILPRPVTSDNQKQNLMMVGRLEWHQWNETSNWKMHGPS